MKNISKLIIIMTFVVLASTTYAGTFSSTIGGRGYSFHSVPSTGSDNKKSVDTQINHYMFSAIFIEDYIAIKTYATLPGHNSKSVPSQELTDLHSNYKTEDFSYALGNALGFSIGPNYTFGSAGIMQLSMNAGIGLMAYFHRNFPLNITSLFSIALDDNYTYHSVNNMDFGMGLDTGIQAALYFSNSVGITVTGDVGWYGIVNQSLATSGNLNINNGDDLFLQDKYAWTYGASFGLIFKR